MNARSWAIGVILATVLASTGCVLCCTKGYEKTLNHGPDLDLPVQCRNEVHVFMMHGLTPTTDCGLNALRMKLGDAGFAKVGMGELCHGGWVKSEIDCIRRTDPDARFVLLGYDLGAATAVSLSRDLTAKGIPVEAVVLLDPMGCPAEPCGSRTLLITSGTCAASVPHSSRVVVGNASHFGLPAHPTTVAVITDLLNDIAAQNCEPPLEVTPNSSAPGTVARRAPNQQPGGEWGFLSDRGPVRAIGTRVSTRPAPSAPGASGAVVQKP